MKIVSALPICAALGAAGCAAAGPDDGWTEDGAPPEPIAEALARMMPRNSLHAAVLSAGALLENEALLFHLASSPLNDGSLSRFLAGRPMRASEKELLEYVVSCALDPGRSVHGSKGEFGLCGASDLAHGNWFERAPSRDCQEVVTACVLARANSLGKRVRISARSTQDPRDRELFKLAPVVPVEKEYREPGAGGARSFSDCPEDTRGWSSARECGWSGRSVGTCRLGERVTLRPSPATSVPLMVRVCKGIHGCDSASSPTGRWYAGHVAEGILSSDPFIKTFYGAKAELSFDCPSSGTTGPWSFAVMVAPPSPSRPLPETADVVLGTFGGYRRYPASEAEVFTVREGAFYGSLFANAISGGSATAMLSRAQYACYSDVWTRPMAHMADRMCAGRDEACFENLPGPCLDTGVVPPDGLCQGKLDGSYHGCAPPPDEDDGPEEPTRSKHVVTVYLNHPCDLASDVNECQKAYAPFSPTRL
ncbi:hypothetical protein BE17_05650 [Sorangium cellulosum]|uniref:Secreted protein n=1 Tax=Sorangium cellulosum TaxID=56 RepID=A0A150S0U1_SORCE|nr:hypothetical protein BE17_05650 [Sorangium cellulosum]